MDLHAAAIDTGRSRGSEVVEVPFLRQIHLFLTFRCQVRCAHCMVEAGPERTKSMSRELAARCIEEFAERGGAVVGFTGGEPFCELELLQDLGDAAHRRGLETTVFTNGVWAEDLSGARAVLARLGCTDVGISASVYHMSSGIALEKVQLVVQACAELGIRASVYVGWDPSVTAKTEVLVAELLRFVPHDRIQVSRIFAHGRARGLRGAPAYPPVNAPCPYASTPFIFPSGAVFPCIGPIVQPPDVGHPLCLGDLRRQSLGAILDDSQRNPLLHGLRMWGPAFLHRLVHEAPHLGNQLPARYPTRGLCETCGALSAHREIADYLGHVARDPDLVRVVQDARAQLLPDDRRG